MHRPFLAAGAFDFLLREAVAFFFYPALLVQGVARGWRELDCSPADELCPCARAGSCICASKCESLLSAHLSVLLSAIQRKIQSTGLLMLGGMMSTSAAVSAIAHASVCCTA